jgi:hypothetical protein
MPIGRLSIDGRRRGRADEWPGEEREVLRRTSRKGEGKVKLWGEVRSSKARKGRESEGRAICRWTLGKEIG